MGDCDDGARRGSAWMYAALRCERKLTSSSIERVAEMASMEQACYLLLLLAPQSRNCLLRDVLDREQHDIKVMCAALIRPLVVHLDEKSVKLLIDKTMSKTADMLPSDLTDLVRHVMPGISFLAEREAERGHAKDSSETRIGETS